MPGTKGRDVLRVDASKVDQIMDLVGELIISRSMIDQALRDMGAGASSLFSIFPQGSPKCSRQLNAACAIQVKEAKDGDLVLPAGRSSRPATGT